jgi:hypothetical protein
LRKDGKTFDSLEKLPGVLSDVHKAQEKIHGDYMSYVAEHVRPPTTTVTVWTEVSGFKREMMNYIAHPNITLSSVSSARLQRLV